MRRSIVRSAGALAVVLACSSEAPKNADNPTPDAPPAPGSTTPPSARTDAGPPEPPYVPAFYDVNHVLGTGQSLSVGSAGLPVVSTAQPYANLMFQGGVVPTDAGLESFLPLVEGTSSPSIGETLSSAMANLVTDFAKTQGLAGHDLLVSVHGIGGIAYANIKKGTPGFEEGMNEVRAGMALAKAQGKSYIVRAVTNVHGETDHANGNTHYADDLVEWQKDYDEQVRAITGQTEPVPMLHTQMSSWTFSAPTSLIPTAQLAASVAHPDSIILVGPKYHLPYAADGVHLTNEGYRHMGEDYAKVYQRVVLEGKRWEPLRPLAITRDGAVVTVKLAVPAPPIVLDHEIIADPGHEGFGYSDDGTTSPDIASVTITGPDTLQVTLTAVPTGPNKRLRYAFYGDVGDKGGPQSGPRGTLRDSDDTKSRNGYALYNWCVHFDEAVP